MESNTPFFSIIIPVYNTVRELRRCVESITCQTYGDFEIILVDDGSTDGSGALCDTLAGEDPRILCIHKENGGCSEARNTGVRAARGAYFLFVDSDDLWDDENALTALHRTIAAKPGVDVVCFGVAVCREDGSVVKIRVPTAYDGSPAKADILQHLIYRNEYISTSYVKALNSDFFRTNQLYFIKGLLSEDIEWSARILLCCRSVAVLPQAFYRRLQRSSGSITSSIGKKNITDILSSIENGLSLVEKSSDPDALKALYYEYWAYQYAMLLGLTQRISGDAEFPQILARLKALRWLLRYDHVKKVRAVRFLVGLAGVRNAVSLLGKYYIHSQR